MAYGWEVLTAHEVRSVKTMLIHWGAISSVLILTWMPHQFESFGRGVVKITSEDSFNDFVANHNFAFLMLAQTDSAWSHFLEPSVLRAAYLAYFEHGGAAFGIVNVDENAWCKDKFDVKDIPSVMVMRKGDKEDVNGKDAAQKESDGKDAAQKDATGNSKGVSWKKAGVHKDDDMSAIKTSFDSEVSSWRTAHNQESILTGRAIDHLTGATRKFYDFKYYLWNQPIILGLNICVGFAMAVFVTMLLDDEYRQLLIPECCGVRKANSEDASTIDLGLIESNIENS